MSGVRSLTRDSGRCAFVARDGRRCDERGRLEFHHIDPYALGGEATVRNISLRCRAHNAHEAVAWFGSRDAARQLERNSGHRLCDGDVESEVLKAGDQPAGSPGVVGLFEVVETEVPVL